MFQVMARKNKVALAADAIPKVSPDRHLTGADIESIVLWAKRGTLSEGRKELCRADLRGRDRRVHPLGAGAGEGIAGDGGRAGVHPSRACCRRMAGEGDRSPTAAPGCKSGWWPSGRLSNNRLLTYMGASGMRVSGNHAL